MRWHFGQELQHRCTPRAKGSEERGVGNQGKHVALAAGCIRVRSLPVGGRAASGGRRAGLPIVHRPMLFTWPVHVLWPLPQEADAQRSPRKGGACRPSGLCGGVRRRRRAGAASTATVYHQRLSPRNPSRCNQGGRHLACWHRPLCEHCPAGMGPGHLPRASICAGHDGVGDHLLRGPGAARSARLPQRHLMLRHTLCIPPVYFGRGAASSGRGRRVGGLAARMVQDGRSNVRCDMDLDSYQTFPLFDISHSSAHIPHCLHASRPHPRPLSLLQPSMSMDVIRSLTRDLSGPPAPASTRGVLTASRQPPCSPAH